MRQIRKLFCILGNKNRLIYTIIIGILVSQVEFIGLTLIVPYISLAASGKVPDNKYVHSVMDMLGLVSFGQLITAATVFILCFYLVRFALNIFYISLSTKFSMVIRHQIMSLLFKHYVHVDYRYFVNKNTASLKKTLLVESSNTQAVVKALIDIVAESFVLLLIMGLIFYTNWKLSVIMMVIFAFIFVFIVYSLKREINRMGEKRRSFSEGLVRQIEETLHNYKFIKLTGVEDKKTANFEKNSYGLYVVSSKYQIMLAVPKLMLETIGLIIILGIVYFLLKTSSAEMLIFTLGSFTVAFYRALPSVTKIINAFNNIQYYVNTLDQIFEEFDIPAEVSSDADNDSFKTAIRLENIDFRYNGVPSLLFNGLNLKIEKGDKVAFTGESGSGKSTLVDIIMGILRPENGKIFLDDTEITDNNLRHLRSRFGYIPQEIYLFDGTVAENVVFGRQYDEAKLIDVLKKANIYEHLMQKDGINTLVGEGGIQLSGGQKQRIGIARAIYDDPEILVLDEATSALDSETEEKIMDEIYSVSNDKTLMIIAHRLSTISRCEKVYELSHGRIIKSS